MSKIRLKSSSSGDWGPMGRLLQAHDDGSVDRGKVIGFETQNREDYMWG